MLALSTEWRGECLSETDADLVRPRAYAVHAAREHDSIILNCWGRIKGRGETA
jgi:hypothetical protein